MYYNIIAKVVHSARSWVHSNVGQIYRGYMIPVIKIIPKNRYINIVAIPVEYKR